MQAETPLNARSALALVVAFGIVSLFADAAYEGMRAMAGPFLAGLGATGLTVGLIAGLGELCGYMLRLFSGRLADSTRAYWPITLTGYIVQMAAVPLLALAGNWQIAALLIVLERTGKAIRNPARDAMLSRAGDKIGHGWAFGLHEVLDQIGAMAGPLIAAAAFAHHHDYRTAFAWLAVPAIVTVISVIAIFFRFRDAGHIVPQAKAESGDALPRDFWYYAVAAGLVGFGFADFTLLSFHFGRVHVVAGEAVALFYAGAMGAAGLGSLLFGRWFDRVGLKVLYPGVAIGIVVAPLALFGGYYGALASTLLWGLSLGIHEAVMAAAVARLVPLTMRARAYGIFTAIFGISWFAGSAVLGALYDVSLPALAVVAVATQILALIPLRQAVRLM